MAWSHSAIFRAHLAFALQREPTFITLWNGVKVPGTNPGSGIPSNDYRCSLWRDTITPDETAIPGRCSYGGGGDPGSPWIATQEVTSGTAWGAGGRTIEGLGQEIGASGQPGYSNAGELITMGGDNAQSAGTLTLPDSYGCMVFDASQDGTGTTPVPPYMGIAFHYFGGPAGTEGGTFTVVWPLEGIAQVDFTFGPVAPPPGVPDSQTGRRRR